MRKYLKENDFEKIDFIYNNAYEFENCVIVGARGWNQTSEPSEQKFIKREVAGEKTIKDGIQVEIKVTSIEKIIKRGIKKIKLLLVLNRSL